MVGEFALIERYFSRIGKSEGVDLAIGDDAALLAPSPGTQLVTAVDTLVADVHFPNHADARDIAQRCMRVNLSDMAAMGAEPKWMLLALTLPESSPAWLQAFAEGMAADAEAFGCRLVGGDTTRGPLSISITMLGEVPVGSALLRSGARPGDHVFVSGSLGMAAAALPYLNQSQDQLQGWQRQLLESYYRPQPQIQLGRQIRGVANAAIDVSDGLLADLGHIAEASGVSIEVALGQLPVSDVLKKNLTTDNWQNYVLSGGDDYQLCFTVSEDALSDFHQCMQQHDGEVTDIGRVVDADCGSIICLDSQHQPVTVENLGYQHF